MSTPNHADFAGAFMDDYFAECDEHLAAIRRALLALDGVIGDPAPPAAVVEDLFRSFHSLKGISAMVELRDAERLAHDMESCLRAIRDREVVLSAAVFDTLVDGVQVLEQVIEAHRVKTPAPSIADAVARLSELSAGPAAGAAAPAEEAPASEAASGQLWKITFTPTRELVARGIKVDTIRGRLADIGRVQSVAPRVVGEGIAFDFEVLTGTPEVFAGWRDDGVEAEPLASPESTGMQAVRPAARPVDAAAGSTNYVRVDLARLDDLMRLVGDLVVSRARLEDSLLRIEPFTPAAEWRLLQDHSGSIERHLRDLREGVMRVRLVPIGEIFRRMPFVVRDLARDHDKRIQLELAGQSTEIDKFLIERMVDPMLHLVRNAVSHGIETPDERIAAGKRPEGSIRLAASTIGESVVLEVSDDGRGMDAPAIAARARAKGIEVPDTPLDSRALLDIISAQGFSTRDAADRVSGRGVGMSVVRETIQELGGSMSVDTAVGRGTTFRIVLPLTLAITDALIVHAGERVFAVPQAAVREVAEVDPGDVRVIEHHELVTHRGAALPLIRLTKIFHLAPSNRPRLHMIVIGADGAAAVGILVDRIAGQREIVVKTLSDPLVKVPGVSGATELGDGRLVLILDPEALARRRWTRPAERAAG